MRLSKRPLANRGLLASGRLDTLGIPGEYVRARRVPPARVLSHSRVNEIDFIHVGLFKFTATAESPEIFILFLYACCVLPTGTRSHGNL